MAALVPKIMWCEDKTALPTPTVERALSFTYTPFLKSHNQYYHMKDSGKSPILLNLFYGGNFIPVPLINLHLTCVPNGYHVSRTTSGRGIFKQKALSRGHSALLESSQKTIKKSSIHLLKIYNMSMGQFSSLAPILYQSWESRCE